MRELNFETRKLQVKINGHVFETDAESVKVITALERLEKGFAEGVKRVEARKGAEEIKDVCSICIDAAEDIFGEGSTDKIFEGNVNFLKCMKLYRFIEEVFTEYYEELKGLAENDKL